MEKIPDKRVYPSNPLGIIALFVFLIEAISTVSLKFLLDAQSPLTGYIVAFITLFPVIIIVVFFSTLWFRRESLYSPADFRDDTSFVQLFAKIERIEVKQQANQVDPRSDAYNQALPIIQSLLSLDEIQAAINLGKAFLKAKRHSVSFEIFEYIETQVQHSNEFHPKILVHLAYSLIGQHRYQEAIRVLLKARREMQFGELGFWPALGLAYSYFKISNQKDYSHWLLYAKSFPKTSEVMSSVAEIYPEFKDEFLTNNNLQIGNENEGSKT